MKQTCSLAFWFTILSAPAFAEEPWRQVATHATMLAIVLSVNLVFFFFLFLVSAISNQRKHYALTTLAEEAYLDPLTRLLNRRGFERRLNQPHQQTGFLIILDIDDFKKINDAFGHDAGDRILSAVALRLQQALRPQDIVSRFGGEEFVVYCNTTHLDEAARLGERLVQAVGDSPFNLPEQNQQITVTVSAGAAALSESPATYLQAYRQADTLLYQAKSSGKNRFIGNP